MSSRSNGSGARIESAQPDPAFDPRLAKSELERILQSEEIRSAPRLSRFLSYVVERSIAGDADSLKEYAIGLEVFDRPPSFDPRTDSIVRVQARRLRQRLNDYYAGDGAGDPYRIEIPTGGYVPELRRRPSDQPRPWARLVAAGAAAVLLAALAVWLQQAPAESVSATGDSPPLSVPLTAFEGHERHPDLSPDGTRIAFVWDGGGENNYNIYVKPLESDALVRLTRDPAPECCPAWSPDGGQVAFLRPTEAGADLAVTSAEGGAEQTLAHLSHLGERICWSSSGADVAVEDRPAGEPPGIFLVSAATGAKRRITSAPTGQSDRWPALSPDGRTLAFVRGNALFAVHTVALDADGAQAAEPVRATNEEYPVGGLDWTPDGQHLVFGAYGEEVGWRLWKIAADAQAGRPAPLPMLGTEPSFARPPLDVEVRLAYVAMSDDQNLYRIPGPGAPGASRNPERIAGSSRSDSGPRLNPKGDRIVFVSGQSGYGEIRTMRIDGSEPRQITDSGRVQVGTPSWSPDGRLIGFNGLTDESFDVYLIDAAGGAPRPFTDAPSTDGGANWSLDGRWIYFMSDRSGRPEIWKKPASGGEAIQVTLQGGFQAMEAPGSRWLYFVKSVRRPGVPESLPPEGERGVFRMPIAGGPEERGLEEGAFGRWALSYTGVYLLRNGDAERPPSIDYFPYRTWERETLMTFPRGSRFGMANSLTVSLDDRWIVYAKYDHTASDLMLVTGQ